MRRLQELVIELTDRCPLRCGHCSSNSGPNRKNALPHDIVKKILVEAAALHTRKISFGGGEPTIAPHFLEILHETIRHGFAAEVFTSGVIFDGQQRAAAFSNDFAVKLSTLGKTVTMVFSFHGSCPAVHDSVTGICGSFELLIDSASKCQAQGVSCAANFVPLGNNFQDFENTVRRVESLGIVKLSILRFVPQGRGLINRSDIELSREEEDRFVEELLHIRRGTSIEIRTGSPFNSIIPENDVPCRAGFQKLVVQADGNVLPCEVFKHQGRKNWGATIYESRLLDVLNLPQFVELKKTIYQSHCATCPVHSELRDNQLLEEVPRGLSQAAV